MIARQPTTTDIQVRPWEAEPYRLWSLLDMMIKPWAHRFGELMSCILDCEHNLSEKNPAAELSSTDQYYIRHYLNELYDYAKELSLDSGGQLDRLLGNLDPSTQAQFRGFPVPTAGDIRGRLTTLRQSLDRELKKRSFLFVPDSRVDFYHEDDKPLFGDEVEKVFRSTTPEIAEFGRCYAVGQWTASVFHLMRATEVALHKWCDDLHLPLKIPAEQANWQDILNLAIKHQNQMRQETPSQKRDDDLEYYGSSIASFTGFKDAWRNHVSHAKVRYDERQATSIMHHVRAFMERLSSRP